MDQGISPHNGSIDGVDIQEGKERYTEKAYLDILRAYCVHTPALLEKVCHAKNQDFSGDLMEEYIIAVHGIKGSTFGICADPAAKQAEALEHAARKKDMRYVAANHDSFIKVTEKLLKDINIFLGAVTKQAGAKPLAPKPDAALLRDIAEACKRYKVNDMEEMLHKLESYQYESGGDLVVWLREQVDNLEYDVIQERLAAELITQ